MMEKENKEVFLTQLTNSPVWERFVTAYENGLGQLFKNAWAVPFDEIPESFQLAALVDWLDTEGVYLTITKGGGKRWYPDIKQLIGKEVEQVVKDFEFDIHYSRSEATKAGIVQAFKILEKKI